MGCQLIAEFVVGVFCLFLLDVVNLVDSVLSLNIVKYNDANVYI